MPIWTDYEVHYLEIDTDENEDSVVERLNYLDRTNCHVRYVPDEVGLVTELPKLLQRLTLKGFEVKSVVPMQGGEVGIRTLAPSEAGKPLRGTLSSFAHGAGFGVSPSKGVVVIGERAVEIDVEMYAQRRDEVLSFMLDDLRLERVGVETALVEIESKKEVVDEKLNACAEILPQKSSMLPGRIDPGSEMDGRFYATEADAAAFRDRLSRRQMTLERKKGRLKVRLQQLTKEIQTFEKMLEEKLEQNQ